ncbi:MAG: hypothetical protein KAI43_00240 [Candidatus Aureabacteria bacterium]|nr:hypothetical protein [Candidatus Auribacterota bacterium]
MKRKDLKIIIFLVIFSISTVFILHLSFAADNVDAKIEGFRFYLTDDDGQPKGVIKGYNANFISPDEIEITDSSAQITDISKHPILIQTPKCIFIKSKSKIISDLPVVLRSLGIEVNGIGMEWSFAEKKIIINKEVIVDVAKNIQKKHLED